LATIRCLVPVLAVALAGAAVEALAQAYCAPPKTTPQPPPPPPPPPPCEPKVCNKCTTSPCYVDSGIYVNDAVDLSIPTNGFPLLVGRHYDSSLTVDGPLGIGWTSSLTPHLYYATYLYAPNVYQYEADVIMPEGARHHFTMASDGTFAPPPGRRDTLVRNANGTFTMTLQRSRSTYSFGTDGSLTSMTDDFGNALTFTYDANGRVQTIADASGSSRSLTVTWNPQGRIADISDSSTPARHIVYAYDADGTLTGVRDPVTPSGQQSTSYTYAAGRYGPVLQRIDDRWGRAVSRLTWQADGKLKSYTEGDYNDANPPASTGEKYTYTYASGSTSKADSLGALTHSYVTNGLITDYASYDPVTGNVLSSTDGAGVTTTYQYDGRGNISIVGKGGVSFYYTYDANYPDQVSTITPKDFSGNMLTNYASWSFDYNSPTEATPGALKRVKRYNSSRTATQTMAEYVYDAKGHVTSATDELLRVSTFTYNAAGDRTLATVAGQTTTYAPDPMGRVMSVTDAAGHMTSYSYDALDRILTVRLPKPSSASTLDFLTTYTYDNLDSGVVYVIMTDPNGRMTKTGYDALGHVVKTIDALGNVTQFTYQYNLLKSITDANGNVTSYSYNANRNLASTTLPDNAVETVQTGYDGTVLSVTDRRGSTTSYTRDSLDRITVVNYSGYNSVNYVYDGERLASVVWGTLGAQLSTTFTYDDYWRLASETRAGEYTITYPYVPPWQPTGFGYTLTPAADQPGPVIQVAYQTDTNQRVTAISGDFGTFTIDYNTLGQYSKITYPNGQTREFAYDDQGRLTTLSNRYQGTDLATFQYAYDYDWSTSIYSMLGQRTSVTSFGTALSFPSPTQTKYTYDGNYQLTGMTQGVNFRSWAYDAIGNRIYAAVPYTYYKNGTNPLNGQRLQNDGAGPDFTYDANGNVTGRAGSILYTWDSANRLASSSGTTYAYDDANRRISATTNGTTTKYIPWGLNTIRERTGKVVRDYVFGPGIDEPLAKLENGVATYYSVDGLGSIMASTDAYGNVLNTTSYDPWGITSLSSQSPLFGFTGRETAGGLWHYRARYYDPSIGRFLSEDPLSGYLRVSTPSIYTYLVDVRNLFRRSNDNQADTIYLLGGLREPVLWGIYSYVDGDPVNRSDPLGLAWQSYLPNPWGCAALVSKCHDEVRCCIDKLAMSQFPYNNAVLTNITNLGVADPAYKVCFENSATCKAMMKKCTQATNPMNRPGTGKWPSLWKEIKQWLFGSS